MDPSTGRVSPAPDLINSNSGPLAWQLIKKFLSFSTIGGTLPPLIPEKFMSQLQEGTFFKEREGELLPPSIWSLLPPMLEQRELCAAVNIPSSSDLATGGVGRNDVTPRSTGLRGWPCIERGEDGDAGRASRQSVDLLGFLRSLAWQAPSCQFNGKCGLSIICVRRLRTSSPISSIPHCSFSLEPPISPLSTCMLALRDPSTTIP
ncbi:hypothetical protein ACTXT7_016714 [Hymenolepis weldensis]